MSVKKLSYKEKQVLKRKEEQRLKEVRRRYFERNYIAVAFCLSHKFSVYPAAQRCGRLKLFKQHHDKFLPVSKTLYEQEDKAQMMEMIAVIDKQYEFFYEKYKHKGRGQFYPIRYEDAPCGGEHKDEEVTDNNTSVVYNIP